MSPTPELTVATVPCLTMVSLTYDFLSYNCLILSIKLDNKSAHNRSAWVKVITGAWHIDCVTVPSVSHGMRHWTEKCLLHTLDVTLNCTARNHQGTIHAAKIRRNKKFAAFYVFFLLTKIKVDPKSWCNKLSIKALRVKKIPKDSFTWSR